MDKRKIEDERQSTKPSTSRISRLVQPRKYSATPAGKTRSSSTENLSLSYNNSTFKRARSVCTIATPASNLATPIGRQVGRSLYVISTPASSYKNQDNEKIIRILQVLRNHFGSDFLPDGLHTMSAKQFNEIMKFFALKVCDNKFQQTSIQENNTDAIKKFIDFIEYPHQTNKSWFRTPTLKPGFDRIVELLDWLCDFVSSDEEWKAIVMSFETEDMLTDVGDAFGNLKYLQTFCRDVKTNYQVWSEDTPKFELFLLRLTESLINQKTGLTDINAHIAKIKDEQEELINNQCFFQKDHLLQTQKEKSQKLKQEINQLKDSIDENGIEFQEKSFELTSSIEKNEKLQKKYAELQHTIKTQKFTAEDRQRVVTEEKQKKHLVNEKEEMINVLQRISGEHQCKIARLQSQKVCAIYGYNAPVQNLFKTEGVVDFDGIRMEQLLLHDNYNESRIKEILNLCEGVKVTIRTLGEAVSLSLTASQAELTSVAKKLYETEDALATAKKDLLSVENQIQKVDNELADTMYESQQQQKQIQSKIDPLLQEQARNNSKLESIVEQSKIIEKENEKLLHGIELKANEMMEAKLRRMARRNEALLELERLAGQLRSHVSKLTKRFN